MRIGVQRIEMKMQVAEDTRYRMTVLLVAERRPRYWTFHCPVCSWKVAELSGTMVSISDVADTTSIPDYHPAPIAIRCRNRDCKSWYEFAQLSGR